MAVLMLPVKRVYFEQIRDGVKPFEFRLRTPYWRQRIEGRHYDTVVVTWGYPKADDKTRRLERPYRGYHLDTITHEHFGPLPVEVFAIDVTAERTNA